MNHFTNQVDEDPILLLSDDDEDLLAGYTGKLYIFIKFLKTWILV